MSRQVKEVGRVPPFMLTKFHAIDPDTGLVKGGPKVKFHMLSPKFIRQGQHLEVPRGPLIVIVLAKIPGVRDGH